MARTKEEAEQIISNLKAAGGAFKNFSFEIDESMGNVIIKHDRKKIASRTFHLDTSDLIALAHNSRDGLVIFTEQGNEKVIVIWS